MVLDGRNALIRIIVGPNDMFRARFPAGDAEACALPLQGRKVSVSHRLRAVMSKPARGIYWTAGWLDSRSVSARVVSAMTLPASVTTTRLGLGRFAM